MSEAVKPKKRRYRSSLRAVQAGETRIAILDAAHRLFAEKGWQTTIAMIAGKASVSKETVYAVFGNKQAILHELIVSTVRGGDAQTPLTDQPERQSIFMETDQRRQVLRFTSDIAAILARVAPLVDVVRSASRANPEMAALYETVHRGRRENLRKFVAALAERGNLRDNLDQDAATDIVWRLASPELYLLMTGTEGVTKKDYAEWLAGILQVSLLDAEPPGINP